MDKCLLVRPNKRQPHWADIKLMLFDCDGVLTDGRIIYGNDAQELKHFNAHDGMGFNLLRFTEVRVGFVTGRSSAALEHRCKDMHVEHLYQNVGNKLQCVDELLAKLNLEYKNVVFMGDDWNDIPVMRKVALSACPADACPDIRKIADWTAPNMGGHGAVRDLIVHVLTHKGIYEKTVLQYLESIS
jgi:3-deoxy-D-manno-octulosonate 8-phosphate phosphatase (KDO 8-P phosphatase)